jgi:hypothetical protein
MRILLTAVCILIYLAVLSPVAHAQVYVNPYTRSDGTTVQGHYRSVPDGNPYNNYSYPGNTNPYTGRVAPGNPDTYLNNHNSNGTGYAFGTNHQRRSSGAYE